jgi:serine/threonine protein phosphatase PrpC
MLCSDGLCGVIEDESIEEILRTGSAADAAEALIAAANNRGGPDNITVQVIRIPEARGVARIVGIAVVLAVAALALWALFGAGSG